MSNHSHTPWNPDSDNTIAADAIDAGPRSVTFPRLAYSDQLDIPDVPDDEPTVAVYKSEQADARMWVRPLDEFEDKFERAAKEQA